MKTKVIACCFIALFFTACRKDPNDNNHSNTNRNDQILVKELKQELNPLTQDPLSWSDTELRFLDAIADKPMIGLGEATHGTSEFFKAKHRIFRYLVEKHNYKIFAFEADFGESLLINEAIQKGDSTQIESLMKNKMLFWTWKTEEVKDLLVWMCKYNLGKSDDEKVQYMGIDCQYLTYNPGLLEDYLTLTHAPFFSYAKEILVSTVSFSTNTNYANYLIKLDNLLDTMTLYKPQLIAASSEKKYLLNERILKTIRQTLEGRFDESYRDRYMAENAVWLLDYFNRKKIVVWAHDGHIANGNLWGVTRMGYHLNKLLSTDYVPVGFLFSTGYFNALSQGNGTVNILTKQVINTEPMGNSINYLMYLSKESVFSVKVADLQKYSEWDNALSSGIQYLCIGALYSYLPDNHYYSYNPASFNYLIYFNNTTASAFLQ